MRCLKHPCTPRAVPPPNDSQLVLFHLWSQTYRSALCPYSVKNLLTVRVTCSWTRFVKPRYRVQFSLLASKPYLLILLQTVSEKKLSAVFFPEETRKPTVPWATNCTILSVNLCSDQSPVHDRSRQSLLFMQFNFPNVVMWGFFFNSLNPPSDLKLCSETKIARRSLQATWKTGN